MRVARAAREMGIVPLGIYSEADADAYHLPSWTTRAASARLPRPNRISMPMRSSRRPSRCAPMPFIPATVFSPSARRLRARCATRASSSSAPLPRRWRRWAARSKQNAACASSTCRSCPDTTATIKRAQRCARRRTRSASRCSSRPAPAAADAACASSRIARQFDEALDAAKREALRGLRRRCACSSSATCATRATSSFRFWPTRTARRFISASASARSSGAIKKSSRRRRRSRCAGAARRDGRGGGARGRIGRLRRTPARASSCSMATAAFYFLEMNARLQVEHPVTEIVYGVDLVQWQLRIADGERLTLRAGRRAAARLGHRGAHLRRGSRQRYAALDRHDRPLVAAAKARAFALDAGVTTGSEVSLYYDPMLAKLIVYGSDRAARDRAARARARGFRRRTACARTCRCCCGSRATQRSDAARRRRASSRSVSTNPFSHAGAAARSAACSAPARFSPTATRRGASPASACRCALAHAGGIARLVADAGAEPGVVAPRRRLRRRIAGAAARRPRARASSTACRSAAPSPAMATRSRCGSTARTCALRVRRTAVDRRGCGRTAAPRATRTSPRRCREDRQDRRERRRCRRGARAA